MVRKKTSFIGFAFPDHIKAERVKRKKYHEVSSEHPHREFLLKGIVFISFILLFLKLGNLQLIHGSYYRTLSDSNRIRTRIIHAPRGVIFDRNNIPLVYNIPGFRDIKDKKAKLLSRDEALALIAKGSQTLEVASQRQYPFKDELAHVLGYVGQISEEQVKSPEFANYLLTDFVGKEGIEKVYEKNLRGVDGHQLVEVDATGKPTRILGQTDPLSGADITLTIDSKLQEASYKAMASVKKGAVIVSTPKGEILSLISKPSYDPNLFTMDDTYKTGTSSGYHTVSDILTDADNQPLLNRAIGGTYPPGSTFKLITAVSGLENKTIDKDYTIVDNGIIKINQYSFSNWYYSQYGKTEGPVNVVKAIARSNDIFFYKLADMISVDKLSQTGATFGLGQKLGIDLDGEEKGVLPGKTWKEKEIGEQWYQGDTFIYGIGQGYLLTTPLQVNAWTQVFANGGTLYKPHLLMEPDHILNKNIMSTETANLIRDGMVGACDTGGTAYPLFNFTVKNPKLAIDGKDIMEAVQASGSARIASTSAALKDYRKIAIACKTGTAQHGDDKTEPHAWLTLFAPAYHPEIVITVLAESSGEGSTIAGPIAKEILQTYFEGKEK